MADSSQVTLATAPRREKAVQMATEYQEENPHVSIFSKTNGKLDTPEYQDLLIDSQFTICPGGHNPETYRMFEALESG